MSRVVKYVSSDFEWPLRKVWGGYQMPAELLPGKCTECNGSGITAGCQELYDRWYGKAPFRPEERGSTPFLPGGPEAKAWADRQIASSPQYYGTGQAAKEREAHRICAIWNRQWSHHLNQDDVDALVAADRLMEFNHDRVDRKWIPNGNPVLAADVNRAYLFGMGHDAINAWTVIGAEAKRLGLETSCPHCDDGQVFRDEEHKTAYEGWEENEPPSGNHIQMWETVSAGSPISPVFESSVDLAKWLEKNDRDGKTADEWLAMIRRGASIGSGIAIGGVVFDGVEAVSILGGNNGV